MMKCSGSILYNIIFVDCYVFLVSQDTFSVELSNSLVNFLGIYSRRKLSQYGNNNQECNFAVEASTRPEETVQLV